MKAIDYYNRDHAAFFASPDLNYATTLARNLVKEFIEEAAEIVKSRRAVTDRAVQSVLIEQNKKWNALVRLYKKKHNVSPIREDGFARFYEMLKAKKMTEIKENSNETQ